MPNIAKTKQQFLLGLDYIYKEQYIEADLDNIRETLPQLKDYQQEDILRIEQRFQVGKGFLSTAGTGTGKTYTGLGITKRFLLQQKKNILIVVPTDPKCQDWVKEAGVLDIHINILNGIKDAGVGVCVTTYANYYQNKAIEKRRPWDLIVYDECHYLNQNAKGDETVYLMKHKKITGLPSTIKPGVIDRMPDPPAYKEFPDYDTWREALLAYQFQINSITDMKVNKTKVLFLSATPFAYHKSIMYADGCLLEIDEKLISEKDNGTAYNESKGFERFLQEKLGYRMRFNKLTIPDVGVDQDLLERELFEEMKSLGVLSTKVLELNRDYSRHFIKVHNTLGQFIDDGISMWHKPEIQDKYPDLYEVVSRKYNYLFVNQLLECVKVQETITRIRQHLRLGRKVVVFHSYNHAVLKHPFKFDIDEDKLLTEETRYLARRIQNDIYKWEADFPEYVNLDLDGLKNVRASLKEYFPDALEFNGTVPKKKRMANIDSFNSPRSGKNLIIVQSKAGREGISLHDKLGDRQRVLINLALPVAPTEAIQTEGRIYRYGVNSDAIYEYITLHTVFEKIAFADKIASRAKTAENLAMGNLARDLETSFKEGYIDADNHEPYVGQGVGGKEKDKKEHSMNEFQKSITYYYKRAKKNSKNKSFEGADYFATPEPLGYKMVEWLNPQPEERGLEPSAGHGAISRYFPKYCSNTLIEPSLELFSEMALVSSGRTIAEDFESFSRNNKYDFVAMNPPFGSSGKTAFDHIQKAVLNHSPGFKRMDSLGFRVLAIVPCGISMEKRLEEWFEMDQFRNFNYTGEILLPGCTFERAGTKVMTRVIRIEHVSTRPHPQFQRIDLSSCENITELFDRLEHLDFKFV